MSEARGQIKQELRHALSVGRVPSDPPHLNLCGALLILFALASPDIRAQEPGEPQHVEPQAQEVDVFDLWRIVRGRPPETPAANGTSGLMPAFSPVVGAKPSTGPFFGLAGNVAFHAGDHETTRVSSSVIAFTISTKAQVTAAARHGVFTGRNQWYIEGDNRLNWIGQTAYGLGFSAPEAGVYTKYDWFRVHDHAYYQVFPFVYLGAGLQLDYYRDVRPGEEGDPAWEASPYVEYSTRHGLDLDTQTSAGGSLSALVDTRDHPIRPTDGWRARGAYRAAFDGFLGGSTSWQRVEFDLRNYRGLDASRRRILAVWLRGELGVNGDPPYFDLPGTGTDTYGRSSRGYAEGRYRGERLLAAEIEYRTTLTANGLLGAVVFANATTVSSLTEEQSLFDFVAPGVGAGLRLLINKKSKTNLCFDVGFGRDGSRAIYLAVQEAF